MKALFGRALVIIFIFLVYCFHASKLEGLDLGDNNASYYPMLTDGFLAGELGILPRPSDQILSLKNWQDPKENAPFRIYNDASIYKGRYYIYYGPVPVILFFLPYRILTGRNLSEPMAITIQAFLAFLALAWILIIAREKFFKNVEEKYLLLSLLAVGLATGVPFVITRPAFYEVALTCSLFLSTWSAALVFSHYVNNREGYLKIMAASFFLGLAIGARPTHLFATLAILSLLYYEIKVEHSGLKEKLITSLKIITPCLLSILSVGAYNFLRFNNPFEFGINLQVAGMDPKSIQMSFRYFLPNIFNLFLNYPKSMPSYPFFLRMGDSMPLFLRSLLPSYREITLGLFAVSPIALPGILFLLPSRRRFFPGLTQEKFLKLNMFLNFYFLHWIAIIAFYFPFAYITARYSLDYFPAPVLAGALSTFYCLETKSKIGIRWTIGASLVSIFVAFSIGLNSYNAALAPLNKEHIKQFIFNPKHLFWGPQIPHGDLAPKSLDEIAPESRKFILREKSSIKKLYAIIKTSFGEIKCNLLWNQTPNTVANFVGLAEGTKKWFDPQTKLWVNKPFYDGLKFNQVVDGFMVKSGNPLDEDWGGPGYEIPPERGRSNYRLKTQAGNLVMAVYEENLRAGSQFMITTISTPWINEHTVFGEVVEGMDVVKRISHAKRDDKDRPIAPIIIEKVTIIRE